MGVGGTTKESDRSKEGEDFGISAQPLRLSVKTPLSVGVTDGQSSGSILIPFAICRPCFSVGKG